MTEGDWRCTNQDDLVCMAAKAMDGPKEIKNAFCNLDPSQWEWTSRLVNRNGHTEAGKLLHRLWKESNKLAHSSLSWSLFLNESLRHCYQCFGYLKCPQ